MAKSLETLRSNILTSIFGRRLGLDPNEFMVGPKDIRLATQTLTSATTGTNAVNYGITGFNVTTASASTASSVGTTEVGRSFLLDPPSEGVSKILYNANSTGSTASVVVEFGTGVTCFSASLGSTFTGLTMWAGGQYAQLVGVSTSQWMAMTGSTGTSFASSN